PDRRSSCQFGVPRQLWPVRTAQAAQCAAREEPDARPAVPLQPGAESGDERGARRPRQQHGATACSSDDEQTGRGRECRQGPGAVTDPFVLRGGELYAEGVPLSSIAERFGTPTYVYSRAAITAHYRAFVDALQGQAHRICYAVKANGNLA